MPVTDDPSDHSEPLWWPSDEELAAVGRDNFLRTGMAYEASQVEMAIGSAHESILDANFRVIRAATAEEFGEWWAKTGAPDHLDPRRWLGPLYFYRIEFD